MTKLAPDANGLQWRGGASSRPTLRVDPGRLLRALRLEVERVGPRRYRVTGGERSHVVLVRDHGPWRCDCADTWFHPTGVCKHRLGTYLALQLAEPIRVALRDAMPGAK